MNIWNEIQSEVKIDIDNKSKSKMNSSLKLKSINQPEELDMEGAVKLL